MGNVICVLLTTGELYCSRGCNTVGDCLSVELTVMTSVSSWVEPRKAVKVTQAFCFPSKTIHHVSRNRISSRNPSHRGSLPGKLKNKIKTLAVLTLPFPPTFFSDEHS